MDFTQLLPAPYTGGRFQPPAPGAHGIDSPYVFNTIDLLGGLLDFGVVGGTVYPAINVNLHSDSLQFTLNDELAEAVQPRSIQDRPYRSATPLPRTATTAISAWETPSTIWDSR